MVVKKRTNCERSKEKKIIKKKEERGDSFYLRERSTHLRTYSTGETTKLKKLPARSCSVSEGVRELVLL